MKNIEIEQKQKKELQSKLWGMANSLRGNMAANEFQDYILGLIFFRYISEHQTVEFNKKLKVSLEKNMDNDKLTLYRELALNNIGLGYFIEPELQFENQIMKIKAGNFGIEDLSKAFESFSNSTKGTKSEEQLSRLFSDINLSSDKLGKTYREKSDLIAKLMQSISEIDFNFMDSKIDLLGDAYEYMIGQFAATAGKKAGEFYTPQQVSRLLSLITTHNKTDVKNISDPTCGSGSLLLQVINRIEEKGGKYGHVYGQEMNTTTANLARMNMIVHNVDFNKFSIHDGDTLKFPSQEQATYGLMDIVVANPPFSAKWAHGGTMEKDERFSGPGVLAPKSYADYAFVLHMINSLSQDGRMAVVLPHGPLFRSNAEAKIRRFLVETRNYLDTVIGLPANLFYGTGIPTCICVFKKDKKTKDVYFIDASKNFEKVKNQNMLRDEDIEKIMDAYTSKKEIDKFAHLASEEELKENDYNLNIPRYVDTFEEEEPIDIHAVMAEIKNLEAERSKLDIEIAKYLKELGFEA